MSHDEENPLANGLLHSSDEDPADAIAELQAWKMKIEKAEIEKSRLLLEKLDTEEAKKRAQKEMTDIMEAENQLADNFQKTRRVIKDEISSLEKGHQYLMERLQRYKAELRAKKDETAQLQQRFKIKALIPEKRVNFSRVENEEMEHTEDIEGVFTITQRPSVLLHGGQALITFEEEKVAEQILRLDKCSVACDNQKVDVKPLRLPLETSVKFEVHTKVSKRTIKFCSAHSALPEERMRDRLEMSFSRPSRGGGEVERVDYDKGTGKGRITFLNTGVAESLALKRKYCVDANPEIAVNVAPVHDYQLKKFQTFSGVPKRTVLLTGIRNIMNEEDLQDHLEIHFQKPSNSGGEVENIKYVSVGNELNAFFSEDCTKMDA